jgi:UDP-N-acetylglucosamine 4-epimerase
MQANHLAALVSDEQALNQVYNVAHGERTTLTGLFNHIKELALNYDQGIKAIEPVYGPERTGDIPHSLASIEKAKQLLGYSPTHNIKQGLKEAVDWYWKNL